MKELKDFIKEGKKEPSVPPDLEAGPDLSALSKASKNLLIQEHEFYDPKKLDYQSYEQNIKLRKKYAYRIFYLICSWLGIILAIIIFQAVSCIPGTSLEFELSDTVIVTLITTTTANIATYFLVVTRYLFPNKKR